MRGHNLLSALVAIRSSGFRTFLTILIISIGVAGLIAMQSAIVSIKSNLTNQFVDLGANSIKVDDNVIVVEVPLFVEVAVVLALPKATRRHVEADVALLKDDHCAGEFELLANLLLHLLDDFLCGLVRPALALLDVVSLLGEGLGDVLVDDLLNLAFNIRKGFYFCHNTI